MTGTVGGRFDGERWRRVEEVFAEAFDGPPDRRDAVLAALCGDDSALRDEVAALLRAADSAGDYFDRLGRLAGVPRAGDLEGRRLGSWRLVRFLGQGGMGTVYLAERADGQFQKEAAVKLLPLGLATEVSRRRFLTERQVLAGLEHPNVARLLDGGIDADGTPYFVMEYAPGRPIDEYCAAGRLPVDDRIRLFLQVLDAVDFAHRKGVVHRDLKPANVLVSEEGRVKLLDFGIAKLLDSDRSGLTLTRVGEGPLTPRYASPEQIRGEPVTPVADVYALGVMLFELVAGCPPYPHDDVSAETLRRSICDEEVKRPSSLAPPEARDRLRGDVDAIVLKALRKEPAHRYASAADFAADLDRHLGGQPVLAARGTLLYRGSRLVRRRYRVALGAGGLALAAAAAALWPAPTGVSVLAIGTIEDRTRGDTLRVAQALPGLLAFGLEAIPSLRVVTPERMHEVRSQLEASGERVTSHAVAQLAGAGEVLEGELHTGETGGLRLELRRVDVQTGRPRAQYVLEGPQGFVVAGRAIARVARDLGLKTGTPAGLGDASPASILARRLYDEGLRAYYGATPAAAAPLFEAALREDSTLAMAAYYLWRAGIVSGGRYPGDTTLAYSVRIADHASDRERLLIEATWASALQERNSLALAESLAARYPLEPDGHLLLGVSRMASGDFLGAVAPLERVVLLDSLSLRGGSPRCRACQALLARSDAYMRADSGAAAMRAVEEWIRLQPGSPDARRQLAELLIYFGRFDEAVATRRVAQALSRRADVDILFPARVALHAGQWSEADRLFRQVIDVGTREDRLNGLWWLTLSLREQGRFREALETARAYRSLLMPSADDPPPYSFGVAAAILMDSGRPRDAALLLDSIAAQYEGGMRGWQARSRAWILTQRASALAAAGDTAALEPLARMIRGSAEHTRYGLVRDLDGYVRGLLLMRRGDADAAVREFRRAVYSIHGGYGRLNLELGRALLTLGRPAEAAAVLEAPLRGPIESGNAYSSRTELRAAAGAAWEAAGRPDSAASHYRWVLRAWQSADPVLRGRREDVAARLAALRAPAGGPAAAAVASLTGAASPPVRENTDPTASLADAPPVTGPRPSPVDSPSRPLDHGLRPWTAGRSPAYVGSPALREGEPVC